MLVLPPEDYFYKAMMKLTPQLRKHSPASLRAKRSNPVTGGCAASTAPDYLRFAIMLMNGGRAGEARLLGPRTVDYMLSDQLGPNIKNLVATPTRPAPITVLVLVLRRGPRRAWSR
jgi:CubicO group peptidase (beta-lactamase class C family)